MKILLPIVFATIAAIGNAMFALGQKKSAGVENGLLFVGHRCCSHVLNRPVKGITFRD